MIFVKEFCPRQLKINISCIITNAISLTVKIKTAADTCHVALCEQEIKPHGLHALLKQILVSSTSASQGSAQHTPGSRKGRVFLPCIILSQLQHLNQYC
jgi:hypothetical protein